MESRSWFPVTGAGKYVRDRHRDTQGKMLEIWRFGSGSQVSEQHESLFHKGSHTM